MNFTTLTAGQHIVTLPIAKHIDDDFSRTPEHYRVVNWARVKCSGHWHVYLHESGEQVDFAHVYSFDTNGFDTNRTFATDHGWVFWLTVCGSAIEDVQHVTLKFVFAEASDAVLFKLTWGGQ